MRNLFHMSQRAVHRLAELQNRIALLFCCIVLASGIAAAQSVNLAWDASTESSLAGYKIYTGKASRSYSSAVTLGKVTTYTTPTLTPGTYYFAVTAYSTSGVESAYSNEVLATVSSSSDTTPPVISGITVSNITPTGATVSWTTNEASDTQVEYGNSTAYGTLAPLNTASATSHSQLLGSLAAGTTYYFRVRSKDASGNLAISAGSSFKTASATGDATAPTVTTTQPASGSAVSGIITVSASATDNVAVIGVQFLLNGAALGVEDTSAPYSISWNTPSYANGSYMLSARARDAAGNTRTSAAVTITLQNTTLTTGLQAGFPFSEGSGSSSLDMSPNANNALLFGSSWGTGRFGSALAFNGATSYARTGIRNIPAPNRPQTLSTYFFTTSIPGSTQVMMRTSNTTANTDLNLGFRNSRLGVWNEGSIWFVSAAIPSAGLWHHVAYTFNGTTHSLYVDGVLAATSTLTPGNVAISTMELGRGSHTRWYFAGRLDEVRIYNRALSSSEINSSRTNPMGGVTAAAATSLTQAEPGIEPAATAVPLSTSAETLDVTRTFSGAADDAGRGGKRPAPGSSPMVRSDMTKSTFSSEEPVELTQFVVENPGSTNLPVELKTWVASSSRAPVSLGISGEDGTFVVPAGVQSELGPVKVFGPSENPAAGSYFVISRMIDPVTGETLSESRSSFVISPATGGDTVPLESPIADGISVSVNLSAPSYSTGDVISVTDLAITNSGTRPTAVQVKIWLESRGIQPVSIMRAGADGYMLIPAGSELTFYQPRDLAVSEDLPRGDYALRCRVLDPVTGQLLADRSVYFEVQ
jgi:hypothetical protein